MLCICAVSMLQIISANLMFESVSYKKVKVLNKNETQTPSTYIHF